MLNYIAYRWKLRKLLQNRQEINERIEPPTLGQEYLPLQDEHDQLEIVEHQIYRLRSDYFWEKAFRAGIPFPSGKEYWTANKAFPGTDHINQDGILVLIERLHERTKRIAQFVSVVIAGITGLVGTITGLVSVLR